METVPQQPEPAYAAALKCRSDLCASHVTPGAVGQRLPV